MYTSAYFLLFLSILLRPCFCKPLCSYFHVHWLTHPLIIFCVMFWECLFVTDSKVVGYVVVQLIVEFFCQCEIHILANFLSSLDELCPSHSVFVFWSKKLTTKKKKKKRQIHTLCYMHNTHQWFPISPPPPLLTLCEILFSDFHWPSYSLTSHL